MKLSRIMPLSLFALVLGAILLIGHPVLAAPGNTTLFSSQSGDVVFPMTPPTSGNPGNLDNMSIGAGTPAPEVVSTLQVDSGTRTATATSGAATLNKASGLITTESLSTATGAIYTLTITDSAIAATDLVTASVQLGTSTNGTPSITTVTPAGGSLVIKVKNIDATNAFNGTLKVAYIDHK